MVDIHMLDSADLTQIVVLVVALGLSFLSLKAGPFLWFITSFAWAGLAALVNNSIWLAGVCVLMALVCQTLFIMGASKSRR